jgi:hypothetical protein
VKPVYVLGKPLSKEFFRLPFAVVVFTATPRTTIKVSIKVLAVSWLPFSLQVQSYHTSYRGLVCLGVCIVIVVWVSFWRATRSHLRMVSYVFHIENSFFWILHHQTSKIKKDIMSVNALFFHLTEHSVLLMAYFRQKGH